MCLYAVTRQWFKSARKSSLFFFLFRCWFAKRSHCALWLFSRWQPSGVRVVHRIMFCARLYTQTSFWQMSLLVKFYISIWQRITAATLTISWFVALLPSRVDCKPGAVALLTTEIGHKMSSSKFCSKARHGDSGGQFPLSKKRIIAVKDGPKPVKGLLEVLRVDFLKKNVITIACCCWNSLQLKVKIPQLSRKSMHSHKKD